MTDKLTISYDEATDIAIINGIQVSGELLRALTGSFPDNAAYRFIKGTYIDDSL